jgi:L-threonylcarbamoyladenylate synthase
MIIPSSSQGNIVLTSKDLTLGLRIPNSDMAQSLLKKTGPLLTSSANLSGFTGSIKAEGVALDFPSLKILGPIPWEESSGKASTIISWKESGKWEMVREGEVFVKGLN